MNTKQLLQYLAIVIDLEKNRRTQQGFINELAQRKNDLNAEFQTNRELNECNVVAAKYNNKPKKSSILPYLILSIIPFYMIGMPVTGAVCVLLVDATGIESIRSFGFIIGIILYFALAVIISSNLRNKFDRAKAKKDSEQNAVDTVERSERNNEIVQIIPALDNEMNTMNQTLNATTQALQKIYAKNIIPPKYRSLVPVCMFYEYISNGRTHTITEDPKLFEESAVNIYERELYMNLIIDRLDLICSKLDVVIENQKILHNTLSESLKTTNALLERIDTRLSTMEYQNRQRQNCSYYVTLYN